MKAPFYRPPAERARRRCIWRSGAKPWAVRIARAQLQAAFPLPMPEARVILPNSYRGSGKFEVSTTMAFVKLLSNLLRNKDIGLAGRAHHSG